MKSVAEALKLITAPPGDVATTVMLPGIVTPGPLMSDAPASSLTSMHPTYRSRAWSAGQGVQIRDPNVLRHRVSGSHRPLATEHSLMSTQPVSGVPLKPGGPFSLHRQPPWTFVHCTPVPHEPLFVAHSSMSLQVLPSAV